MYNNKYMLDKIKEKVSGLFKNNVDNKKTIGLSIFAILLLVISYFVFKKYLYPKLNPTYVANKEFQQTDDSAKEVNKTPDVVKVYFFYTQWCPHCKTSRPEWDKTKEQWEGKIINNYKLHFLEVDCDAKENEEIAKDIDGYPTIKMFLPDGKVVEYDAKPNHETLSLFINSVLNE